MYMHGAGSIASMHDNMHEFIRIIIIIYIACRGLSHACMMHVLQLKLYISDQILNSVLNFI